MVLLSLKNLGLNDELEKTLHTKPYEGRGRRITNFETKKLTLTSRPAKLRTSEQNKIQSGLDFADIMQRYFYENNWIMLHVTHKERYQKSIVSHRSGNYVSAGIFFSLKPFYIRTETEQNIDTITTFKENFHAAFLDIDFSENLSLPVKHEPQFLHWHHDQVTVHTGIVKIHDENSKHKHYQRFVKLALGDVFHN